MRYKNHTIEIQYLPGADFLIRKSGEIVSKKPTAKDIDFVIVTCDDGMRWNESSIKDAKNTIDEYEKKYG